MANTLLISVAIASFYRFNIKVHAEFPSRVAIFMHEILGGVVIDNYLVTVKIGKIFQHVCWESTKISRYMEKCTIVVHTVMVRVGGQYVYM